MKPSSVAVAGLLKRYISPLSWKDTHKSPGTQGCAIGLLADSKGTADAAEEGSFSSAGSATERKRGAQVHGALSAVG